MAIALYARKSVEREKSISCETQLEYCKSMIKLDEKAEMTIAYVDNGYSGGNVKRKDFQRMMADIKAGRITKVIVYRVDRMSRSLADFVNILGTFKKYGVEFISSQEAFDTGSPYGELVLKILAVFAEFERQSIINRITQAYEHRSEMGFYMGGRRPYGFQLEDTMIHQTKTKRFVPIEEEQEQIRYIFEAYAQTNITLRRLQKDLLSKGIEPLSGGPWTTAKLSALLKNPIYVRADNTVYEFYEKHGTNIINEPDAFDGIHGLQLYGKTKHNPENEDWSDLKLVVMPHEGAVDSDIWLKCQRKLFKNKQVRNAVSNQTSWLGGLLICRLCGRTMTTIKGEVKNQTRRYFTCTGKSHLKKCPGPKVTIYAESIENMVYQHIAKKLGTLKAVKKNITTSNAAKINVLKNRMKEIELKEAKLLDAMLEDGFSKELMEIANQKASKLKKEKMELHSQIEELDEVESEIKSVLNLSKRWTSASFEEKRAIARVLISHILIDRDGSVEIVWNV